MEWLHTDDLQRVLQLSENEFVVVETSIDSYDEQLKENEMFANFVENEVDIRDYDENELEREVKYFYQGGLKEIKEIYKGDWKQIVAEIISENENNEFDWSMDNAKKYTSELDIEKDLDLYVESLLEHYINVN